MKQETIEKLKSNTQAFQYLTNEEKEIIETLFPNHVVVLSKEGEYFTCRNNSRLKVNQTYRVDEKYNTKPITESVTSFEDACTVLNINKDELWFIQAKGIDKQTLAFKKLCVIAEALREGVKLDWFDTNQYKYYPWFKTQNNAFVFINTNYINFNSVVPSALCVDTIEKAEYFAKQFIDLWKEYLTSK